MLITVNNEEYEINPEVISTSDIVSSVSFLGKHPNLIRWLTKLLKIDEVNRVHSSYYKEPGYEFARNLVEEEFKINIEIENPEILHNLPNGPFITISNHFHGAWDGILLIYLFAKIRASYKVMVNMILNKISAMQPNFIAVDAYKSSDLNKQKVSIDGIRRTLKHLKTGNPVGFFPAGAMGKINWKLQSEEREWQDSIIRIIQKANVPVIPVYFHGGQTFTGRLLGRINWALRTIRMPGEVFAKRNGKFKIVIGDIISPDQLKQYPEIADLKKFLYNTTMSLKYYNGKATKI